MNDHLCYCGHPEKWHLSKGIASSNGFGGPWLTHCNEWGCRCRAFVARGDD